MKLLARLRFCWRILRARRSSHWLLLSYLCEDAAVVVGWQTLQAECARRDAIDAERCQVAAGIRTIRQAEHLLAEARRLTSPTRSC